MDLAWGSLDPARAAWTAVRPRLAPAAQVAARASRRFGPDAMLDGLERRFLAGELPATPPGVAREVWLAAVLARLVLPSTPACTPDEALAEAAASGALPPHAQGCTSCGLVVACVRAVVPPDAMPTRADVPPTARQERPTQADEPAGTRADREGVRRRGSSSRARALAGAAPPRGRGGQEALLVAGGVLLLVVGGGLLFALRARGRAPAPPGPVVAQAPVAPPRPATTAPPPGPVPRPVTEPGPISTPETPPPAPAEDEPAPAPRDERPAPRPADEPAVEEEDPPAPAPRPAPAPDPPRPGPAPPAGGATGTGTRAPVLAELRGDPLQVQVTGRLQVVRPDGPVEEAPEGLLALDPRDALRGEGLVALADDSTVGLEDATVRLARVGPETTALALDAGRVAVETAPGKPALQVRATQEEGRVRISVELLGQAVIAMGADGALDVTCGGGRVRVDVERDGERRSTELGEGDAATVRGGKAERRRARQEDLRALKGLGQRPIVRLGADDARLRDVVGERGDAPGPAGAPVRVLAARRPAPDRPWTVSFGLSPAVRVPLQGGVQVTLARGKRETAPLVVDLRLSGKARVHTRQALGVDPAGGWQLVRMPLAPAARAHADLVEKTGLLEAVELSSDAEFSVELVGIDRGADGERSDGLRERVLLELQPDRPTPLAGTVYGLLGPGRSTASLRLEPGSVTDKALRSDSAGELAIKPMGSITADAGPGGVVALRWVSRATPGTSYAVRLRPLDEGRGLDDGRPILVDDGGWGLHEVRVPGPGRGRIDAIELSARGDELLDVLRLQVVVYSRGGGARR